MSDRVAELEAKVAELSETLGKMQSRLGALERALSPAAARRVRSAAAAAAASAGDASTAMLRRDAASMAGTVSLVGRTLVVLAGAFFLRALTDSGHIPTWVGVGMAFAYAGIWMALADRAAAERHLASAGFHGAAAVTIGFPLLVEVAARFRIVPIWIDVMKGYLAARGRDKKPEFTAPGNIVFAQVDKTDGTPSSAPDAITDAFIAGTQPNGAIAAPAPDAHAPSQP